MNTRKETLATEPAASVSASWMRALELTSQISRQPDRLLSTVVDEIAQVRANEPALIAEGILVSYEAFAHRMNQYARWAADHLDPGDVVCLLMPNCPEYLAIWLGITSVGGAVSLLNTNLVGNSLGHCIRAVSPRHIIVSSRYFRELQEALSGITVTLTVWPHFGSSDLRDGLNGLVGSYSGETLLQEERRAVSVEDVALHIFTSGTTGLPKAANVSHGRIMQWSHWFAGMMDAKADDRIYNCLPMYHSVGGVQTPGAAIVAGAALVIREKFSATSFWQDISERHCTVFQYIGELCRYLLNATPNCLETSHHLRLACGNGLAPDVWKTFEKRFNIPKILEFYASTEGGVSLFNVEGKQGAIGRVPPYLRHRFSPALIRVDTETGEPLRDHRGLCVRCIGGEAGEAIGKAEQSKAQIGIRFEGYTNQDASRKKLLHDVFTKGDLWVRTGDLMKKDDHGFFYFVDRIGDTFRWKGENVATSEVSETICSFPGIAHAVVYGVTVPAADGRVGMAAIVPREEISLAGLRSFLWHSLPPFAQPYFLRIRTDIDVTGTMKYSKGRLVEEGYDPSTVSDTLYFNSTELQAFTRIDAHLFERIQLGIIRV